MSSVPQALASAGCRRVDLLDGEMGATLPLLVMYPSAALEQPRQLGPYLVDVAMDGPMPAEPCPLVVVSHGSGGSHLVYRTLAAHLARRGFVVAMPEHPGNNRNDNTLAGTPEILVHRPRQVRLVMDWAFSPGGFGAHLRGDSAAVVGHSLGGYTALAVAGGRPTSVPGETPDPPRPIPVVADPRVKALVLLAPAMPWFIAEGTLRDVHVPILLLTAEKDVQTPEAHALILKRGLPPETRLEHHVAPNAGHYAFLSPFPPHLTSPSFPPSQDPEGFDRAAFHVEMNARIEGFLRGVF